MFVEMAFIYLDSVTLFVFIKDTYYPNLNLYDS